VFWLPYPDMAIVPRGWTQAGARVRATAPQVTGFSNLQPLARAGEREQEFYVSRG
jgi:hypothetical protein